jgi:hypothetical protein
MRNACRDLVGMPEGIDHHKGLDLSRMIILKWILEK